MSTTRSTSIELADMLQSFAIEEEEGGNPKNIRCGTGDACPYMLILLVLLPASDLYGAILAKCVVLTMFTHLLDIERTTKDRRMENDQNARICILVPVHASASGD